LKVSPHDHILQRPDTYSKWIRLDILINWLIDWLNVQYFAMNVSCFIQLWFSLLWPSIPSFTHHIIALSHFNSWIYWTR
jgi:hypothetical protein